MCWKRYVQSEATYHASSCVSRISAIFVSLFKPFAKLYKFALRTVFKDKFLCKVSFLYNMRCFVMIVTAISISVLFKLKWQKNKSFYDTRAIYILYRLRLRSFSLIPLRVLNYRYNTQGIFVQIAENTQFVISSLHYASKKMLLS